MIVKGVSVNGVANGGSIVPLHEATLVDKDDIGVGLISDQYGLESVLNERKKTTKSYYFIV